MTVVPSGFCLFMQDEGIHFWGGNVDRVHFCLLSMFGTYLNLQIKTLWGLVFPTFTIKRGWKTEENNMHQKLVLNLRSVPYPQITGHQSQESFDFMRLSRTLINSLGVIIVSVKIKRHLTATSRTGNQLASPTSVNILIPVITTEHKPEYCLCTDITEVHVSIFVIKIESHNIHEVLVNE
jgi:hypothetical protein